MTAGLTRAERQLRDQHIAELTRARYTAREIAAAVGVTRRSVERARARTGLSKPRSPYLTDAEIRQAEALLADGASYEEVARTLSRCTDNIRRRFPGQGWPAGTGGGIARQLNAALEAIPPRRRTT